MSEVSRVLSSLANGDLSDKIASDYHGTWGRLKDYANTTVEKLCEIIGQIKESAESVNVAASEASSP